MLRSFFLLLTLISLESARAQVTKADALRRFSYLDFHSSLKTLVSIDDSGIKIFSSAADKKNSKPEFSLTWEEARIFVQMLRQYPIDTLVKVYEKKRKLDPFLAEEKQRTIENFKPEKKLYGIRIAIDPGHIAGDLETGKVEQKFLDFPAPDSAHPEETVKIAEGMLTWQTAMILKDALEKHGAKVFVTRPTQHSTSFGQSYDEWLKKRKKIVLDSLKSASRISSAEHKRLSNLAKEKFFWEFFRDHDLANRIRIMNEFHPDLSVIIHYNVDEKNTDWLKPGTKNFTMCFIGGAMTADNFKRSINKVHFLRLLLTDDLDRSEKISGLTVKEFSKQLEIPIAKKSDATYLEENCNTAATPGVFCRNLALCRSVNSSLVYGECLYQDHFAECRRLNKCDKEFDGIRSNERVKQVADCYVAAILNYFGE